MTLLILAYRAGDVHLRRRRRLTAGEWEALRDWQTGALVVHVLDVIAQFVHLHDERSDPYLDIQIKLLNAGVQPTWVEPEIRGRVHVFDQDFTHPPELRQIESSNVTRSPEQDSQLPRNERITFLLRQHLTPAVAEVLRANAGEEVRFDFAGLRVGLIFRRWSADEDQDPEEKRDYLRLGSYAFRVPERP